MWWDFPFVTKVKVNHYRPDIVVLYEKYNKKCLLILEIAVSDVAQMKDQFQRKLYRYSMNSTEPYKAGSRPHYRSDNLVAQLRSQLKAVSAEVIPVVIGTTGEILKGEVERLQPIFERKTGGLLRKLQHAAIRGSHRIQMTHLALPE
jgi:hypothetical protein